MFERVTSLLARWVAEGNDALLKLRSEKKDGAVAVVAPTPTVKGPGAVGVLGDAGAAIGGATAASAGTPVVRASSPTVVFPAPPPPVNALEPGQDAAVQYEQFSREYGSLSSQDNFDGFRLELQNALTPTLQAAHMLVLGTAAKPGGLIYQFGPNLASVDSSLFVMSRVDNEGTVTVRGIKKLGQGCEFRVSNSSSLSNEARNMTEVACDVNTADATYSGKFAWQGCWLLNGSFSQRITRNLQAGGDITYITANGGSLGSVGLRYTPSLGRVLSLAVLRQPNFGGNPMQNVHSMKMQYFRRVSDRLHLGAEYEVAEEKPGVASALRVGYEYLFHNARVQGLVDTTGKISMVAQEASGLGVSGTIDYRKNDFRFGFMMQLLPPSSLPS